MKSPIFPFVQLSSLAFLLSNVHAQGSNATGPSCEARTGGGNSDYFSIHGVQGTGMQVRQEIRELQKDTALWNLFLQAMARFQAMDQSEKTSYFQIAGIHGAPFGPWDSAAGEDGQSMRGYCPHKSSMFGPWHRPYLALFEQVLYERAVDIASEYPEGCGRDEMLDVAERLRLPYWDWAQDPSSEDDGAMPQVLRDQKVSITYPNGTANDIPNPLYGYNFHPLNYEDFSALSEFRFKNWNHTLRNPLDGYAIDATSRDDEANLRVSKQQPNLRDIVYKLLTFYQPFMQVSNKASGGTIGNFESLHDGIHNIFGFGHMGIVEVSAFDPVFWLHHCNMDRLLAIYQSRYPETWTEDAEQPWGTFAVAPKAVLGNNSPLAPFHKNTRGEMWTANSVRDWTTFSYTYPELQGRPSNQTITQHINRLYKSQPHGANGTENIIPAPPAPGGNTSVGDAKAIDWQCEVNMPTDIKISYSVRAFLGEPDVDPKKWAIDPNYIGQLASMSSPRMGGSVTVTGSIGLTQALLAKHKSGELKALDKATIQAYLKASFTWRIQALDYTEIPRNNPPEGLNVTVFSVPITIPKSDSEVSTWVGEVEYEPEIEGNPPVYNGDGPGGTNSTVPGAEEGGSYNPASGQFEWKNSTSPEVDGDGGLASTVTTVYVTEQPSPSPVLVESSSSVEADPTSGDDPLVSVSFGFTSIPTPSSAIEVSTEAPAPTGAPEPPEENGPGTRTKWVTSIVIVTV